MKDILDSSYSDIFYILLKYHAITSWCLLLLWGQLSTNHLHSCISCEQRYSLPLFWIIFSRMFVWYAVLEYWVVSCSGAKGQHVYCFTKKKKKKIGSLSSEFLPCNAAHCMCKCYLALVVSPVVTRIWELG